MQFRSGAKMLVGTFILTLAVLPTQPLQAEQSQGDRMCEWREDDLFLDDYAHSNHCDVAPPELGNDWLITAQGHWTNAHDVWVYTKIADEVGDPHSLISG